jgi:hypothetical protein
MAYATADTMYLVYGKANVCSWADLDNQGEETFIAERISWALSLAQEQVESDLRVGPYAIPFADPVPSMISYMTAIRAGLLLYDSRRVVTSDNEDDVSWQRKEYDDTLRRILAGQLILNAPLLGGYPPRVVTDETSSSGTKGTNSRSAITQSAPKAG